MGLGTPLAAFLRRALAPGAPAEDADVVFTLAAEAAPREALARGAFSLRDLLAGNVAADALLLEATAALAGAAPGEPVAELVFAARGAKAAAALVA